MKIKIFLLILVFSCINLSFYSCNQNNSQTEIEQFESLSEDFTDIPDYAMYGFKSGVVRMESEIMGMKQIITMYFDDWGNELMNEIHMEFMGQKTHLVTIVKGNHAYQIDMIKRTGLDFELDSTSNAQINYLKVDKDLMEKTNMKYIGEVEILGRQCKEYEIDMPSDKINVKTAIWNGIAMRTESTMMGFKTSTIVTDIQENVKVPAEKFEIPTDIKFEKAEGPISETSVVK